MVDRKGGVWEANTPELQRYFASDLSLTDLCAFCVGSLGWISVQRVGASAQIRARPGLVSRQAIVGLGYFLNSLALGRAQLFFLEDEASSIFVAGIPNIVERLEQASGRRGPACFRQRRVSQKSSPFAGQFERVREAGLLLKPPEMAVKVLEELFEGRFTLVEAREERSRPILTAMGRRYAHILTSFRDRAIGLGFDDHPDLKYGKWISETVRTLMLKDDVWFGEVDALFSVVRHPTVRVRYDRMIMTAQRKDGVRIALSASQLRDSIDLGLGFGELER
ncbi:MAG: hypothetical protein R3D68_07205 [Hyphomicrobiaceae bacterium]